MSKKETAEKSTTVSRILKFAGVGIVATVFDYLVYTGLVMLFFGGDVNMATLASVISGVLSVFVAYFLHNNITWKERNPGKYGIIKFFIWNFVIVLLARPLLSMLFSLTTGLYEFAFMILGWIPFFSSYEFVESTGIYVLMILVTMTLNYVFYEKIVFGKKESRDEKDVESVRETGEEKQTKRKAAQDSDK